MLVVVMSITMMPLIDVDDNLRVALMIMIVVLIKSLAFATTK